MLTAGQNSRKMPSQVTFLSSYDIALLTGAKHRVKQIKWLAENGYLHAYNGRGEIVLLMAEVNRPRPRRVNERGFSPCNRLLPMP